MQGPPLRTLSGDLFVAAITGGEESVDSDLDKRIMVEADELATEYPAELIALEDALKGMYFFG